MCNTGFCSHTTTDSLGTVEGDVARFEPAYTPIEGTRVLSGRLRFDAGGVAEVTFRGQILYRPGAPTAAVYVAGERRLYAEVILDEDTATTVRVAAVPTGKRVPQEAGGGAAQRIGMSGPRHHVYLLEVDDAADRAAYDAEVAQRRDERAAEQAAREARAMLAAVDAYDE